jgi:hypothetical protein
MNTAQMWRKYGRNVEIAGREGLPVFFRPELW